MTSLALQPAKNPWLNTHAGSREQESLWELYFITLDESNPIDMKASRKLKHFSVLITDDFSSFKV
jgi:hypothetical protein